MKDLFPDKTRSLFVAAEALWPWGASPDGPALTLPLGAGPLLADYHAVGYQLVLLADPAWLRLRTEAQRERFAAEVNRALAVTAGVQFVTVLFLDVPYDPRPIWQAARRFGIDLARSILLTEFGAHAGVCRTAGLTCIESSRQLLPRHVAA